MTSSLLFVIIIFIIITFERVDKILKETKKKISFYIEEDYYAKLKYLAYRDYRSVPKYAEMIVANYISQQPIDPNISLDKYLDL